MSSGTGAGNAEIGGFHVGDGAADPAPVPSHAPAAVPRVDPPGAHDAQQLPRHPMFTPRPDDLALTGRLDGVLRVVQDGGMGDGSSRVMSLGIDESGGYLVPVQLDDSYKGPADDKRF